MTKEILLV